jgi:hypothetical protein
MSNRIQGATGTLRRHPVYLSAMTKRIQGATWTPRRHSVYFPAMSNRIHGATGTPRRHPVCCLFLQWVTGYMVPQEHHDTSFQIYYKGNFCLYHQRLFSLHSYPFQKTVTWTSIWKPDISFMCLRDQSALFNPFQKKKMFCFRHSKEHKTV